MQILPLQEAGGGGVAPWISQSFPWIQGSLVIIMAIAAIVMIIAILASPAQTGRGSNAITGASESFYTKHKGKNNQGRLRNLIIICASIIAFCAIMYFVTFQIYHIGG
ncbi:MAG: preprotein translocase subunit SecG [Firmicutes bacterium]|nr:preprotein translocase subunit SecG [Bacillota bacterium]